MLIASGYIEAHDESYVDAVIKDLKSRNIEVTGINQEKVTFLIERESSPEMKRELDSLKDVEGARSVYLAYYTLEGADEEVPEQGAGNC